MNHAIRTSTPLAKKVAVSGMPIRNAQSQRLYDVEADHYAKFCTWRGGGAVVQVRAYPRDKAFAADVGPRSAGMMRQQNAISSGHHADMTPRPRPLCKKRYASAFAQRGHSHKTL